MNNEKKYEFFIAIVDFAKEFFSQSEARELNLFWMGEPIENTMGNQQEGAILLNLIFSWKIEQDGCVFAGGSADLAWGEELFHKSFIGCTSNIHLSEKISNKVPQSITSFDLKTSIKNWQGLNLNSENWHNELENFIGYGVFNIIQKRDCKKAIENNFKYMNFKDNEKDCLDLDYKL